MKYIDRNKNINRGYIKLDVWKESVELFSISKKKVDGIKNLSFKVKAEVEDSIYSVSSNIAEGYGRRYVKETIQFNSIALASLAEHFSQIYTLFNATLIDEDWFLKFDDSHYSLENKLINYNKAIIKKVKNKETWNNDYIIREG